MKTYIFPILLFLGLLLPGLLFAQGREPVVVSPLIGDKLDRVERDYFKLIPHFDGFQEAIFYLNPDSSLSADIKYQKNNEIKDTTIKKYRSLASIRKYIDLVIVGSINDIEDSKKGSTADILTTDSTLISGELIQIKENVLQVYNSDHKIQPMGGLDSYGFKSIYYDEIREVKFKDTFNIALYIYSIAGGAIGYYTVVGLIKDDLSLNKLSAGFWTAIGGAFIGAYLGRLLAIAFPIEIESEDLIETPFDEKDIEGLSDNARKMNEVPYYLK
jgi:hypothetical protein